MNRALGTINLNAGRLVPSLDAERPHDPISLIPSELNIKVSGSGRDDFLWEIGSGSNWLAYHVAVSLALHQFFLSRETSPVPALGVYDQPSQVYFPRRLAERPADAEGSESPELSDEDAAAVRKVFQVMSDVVAQSEGRLQVIVLDHAADTVWSGISMVHLVEEWRDGRKLVPPEWLARPQE